MGTKRLLIKNLESNTTQNEIEFFFSVYGDINYLKINSEKRFALVEMSSSHEAQHAKDALNGTCMWGRVMEIDEMPSIFKWKFMTLL
jgi:RNA recognition motif-containing protein